MAQVVGASYALGDEVGQVAIFVKLIRVALLAPIIIILSITHPHTDSNNPKPPLIPLFLIGFIALIALNSLHILPDMLHTGLIQLSSLCIIMALAALGLKINLKSMMQIGRKPLLLTGSCSLIIAISALGLIYILM